jgi:hypothetical protein
VEGGAVEGRPQASFSRGRSSQKILEQWIDRERKRLLYRISMGQFGTPVVDDVAAPFVADKEPSALDSLASRLAQQPLCVPFSAELDPGSTKFRVLPRDPEAAKRPRTASNPGRYNMADGVVLEAARRPIGERIVNEAEVQFLKTANGKPAPEEPIKLQLPGGYGIWAVAWLKGGTVFWWQEKTGIRKYDFSIPAKVTETVVKANGVAK